MGDGIRTTGIASKNTGTKTVKEKILSLLEYQKYKLIEISEPVFLPKMAYVHKGEKVISFFQNELELGVDIYTEFVSRDYEPEDKNRTLYHWKFNTHWRDEYEQVVHEGTGAVRYIIPVNELMEMETPTEDELFDDLSVGGTTTKADESLGKGLLPDAPFTDATLRDLAAIMLGKPVSNKPWLNEIIKSK